MVKLSVYDLSMVSRVSFLAGHAGPVTTVSCGDDWVLSGSSDSSLRLWQVILLFAVVVVVVVVVVVITLNSSQLGMPGDKKNPIKSPCCRRKEHAWLFVRHALKASKHRTGSLSLHVGTLVGWTGTRLCFLEATGRGSN